MTTLTVNQKKYELDVDPTTPLLWVLREKLQLTGTKFGYGMALCGACTVHMDGEAFVRIGKDGLITVIVNHSEMGQGTYTSVPMMVAEELDADWSKVRYEAAPVAPEYNHLLYGIQMTGGSTSTWTEWERVRKVGAVVRQVLLAAAADTWNVGADKCRTENSQVIHSDGRKLSYGEVVEKASRLTPPQNPPLKDPKSFKLIGKPMKRLDTPDKTNGKAMFAVLVQGRIGRPWRRTGSLRRSRMR